MRHRLLYNLLLVATAALVGCSSSSTTSKPAPGATGPGPAPNKGGERLAPVDKLEAPPGK